MLKNYSHIFVLFVFFFTGKLHAQYINPETQTYNSPYLYSATSILAVDKNKVIMSGEGKNSKQFAWLLQTTAQGDIIWFKKFDSYNTQFINKLAKINNKTLIATGYNSLTGGLPDNLFKSAFWLVKFDTAGTILWERTFWNYPYSQAFYTATTSDSGFVVVGQTTNPENNDTDWLIIKTDSLGMLQWDYTYGDSLEDKALTVAVTQNGKIVIGGYTTEASNPKATVIALDNQGNLLWEYVMQYQPYSQVKALTVADEDIFLTGVSTARHEDRTDLFIMNLNQNGDSVWYKKIRIPFTEIPWEIMKIYNQNYVVLYTISHSFIMGNDIGLLEFDEKGKIIYNRILRRKSDDYALSMTETIDNKLSIAVTTQAYDIGWQVGLLRLTPIDASGLKFISPKKKTITYNRKKLLLKLCITGFKYPQKAVIKINGKQVKKITKFQITGKSNCPYYVETYVDLNFGYNKIEIEVTDYKDYTFSGNRVVFFLPMPSKRW